MITRFLFSIVWYTEVKDVRWSPYYHSVQKVCVWMKDLEID